jgi:hypothetical protein
MPQIEFKDLNCSLSAESFLEDLTDEAVHIVGGTLEGAFALASTGCPITLASAEDYHTFIENTLSNLHPVENHGLNYAICSTTSLANSDAYVVFQTFSTGDA